MTQVALAVAAGYGMFLLFTATALGWSGIAPGPARSRPRRPMAPGRDWLVQAGLVDVRPGEVLAVITALAAVGAGVAWGLFGGVVPPLAGAAAGGGAPVAAARSRRQRRRLEARDAWPRLIEEIRIRTTTLGRSIPQALFDVGRGAPAEMRPAFETARREWLLSTDFERTIAVLKDLLADATADTVCETLLVAHEIGGTDLDRCLAALIDDRILDLQGRKDAAARQAGARFARRFVLVVPMGMALVGLSIGEGRAAYSSPGAQVLVVTGLSLMAACWVWAGRIMRLPAERRVLAGATGGQRA